MPARPAPAPGGIGHSLQEARERRGVSLRQIANTTRISVSVLEALERDDISRLPGGIFSRAFVRSYAVEVGLDPEETIRRFIAQFPVDAVTAGHPAARPVEDGAVVESHRRTAAAFGRLIALSVSIVALMLYFGTRDRDAVSDAGGEGSAGLDAEVMAAEPPPAGPEKMSVASPASTSAVAEAPDPDADRLLVGLVATAPCWVSVTVDGQSVFTREMQAGEREVVEARRDLVLTAGDAAALRLTLNGQEARPLGTSGKVVTLRMTLTSYRQYLAAP